MKNVLLIFLTISGNLLFAQDTLFNNGSLIINQIPGRLKNFEFKSVWYQKYSAGEKPISKTYDMAQKKNIIAEIESKSNVGTISYMLVESYLEGVNTNKYYAEIISNNEVIQKIDFPDNMGKCCAGTNFYNYLFIYVGNVGKEFYVRIYNKISGQLEIHALIKRDCYIDYEDFYKKYRKDWP